MEKEPPEVYWYSRKNKIIITNIMEDQTEM